MSHPRRASPCGKLTDSQLGVRILEYRFKDGAVSQFLVSTSPEVSPSGVVRSVKGRLQHQIRVQIPKAFKENYSIKSIGSVKLNVVQRYLDSQRSYEMIQRIAVKKGHLLSKVRLLPDHIHLTLGCDVKESPGDVALGYMNNIAYSHEMRPLFQYSFYVGTCGEYDLGAIRQALR